MNLRSLTKPLAFAAAVAASVPLAAHAAVPGETQLKGTVTAFDGKYALHVQTSAGDVDAVALHQGTIINPTGLTLRPGQNVTVLGNKDATGVFAANEIDTPYHVRYAPAFDYPYAGFASPFYGPAIYGGPFFSYGFGF